MRSVLRASEATRARQGFPAFYDAPWFSRLIRGGRSDFVYMVPPFLAYYGVISQNQTLLQAAYDQCKLYRQYLVDDDAGGMWKHIVLGNFQDEGHWTTGECHKLIPAYSPRLNAL